MPVYTLSYRQIPISPTATFPNGRFAPRPIVRLALVNGARRVSCHALADSGADHCIFPAFFLQRLGLDATGAPLEMSAGVGSSGVPTFFVNTKISFAGVIEFPVFAGFTNGLERAGIGLLGQSGFFDRFNVYFRLPEKTWSIEIPDRA